MLLGVTGVRGNLALSHVVVVTRFVTVNAKV